MEGKRDFLNYLSKLNLVRKLVIKICRCAVVHLNGVLESDLDNINIQFIMLIKHLLKNHKILSTFKTNSLWGYRIK